MPSPYRISDLIASHKPMPILSYPCTSLINENVYNLTHNAAIQAKGIIRIAETVDAAAAVTMMDLSVEAEAFGCSINASENQIPYVSSPLLSDECGADSISIPEVGDARTGLYIEAAANAKAHITDRPVIAGIMGPFSLSACLIGVTKTLSACTSNPDLVHTVLAKSISFLSEYAKAYKSTGLDGIIMAEPIAGLLSPELEKIFASPYDKKIIDSVQDDNFAIIYHNCGPNTPEMTKSIAGIGASAYHFGDAVSLLDILNKMPGDCPVMGNISPLAEFLNGTPESMTAAVNSLLEKCADRPNFLLSSGCDIPYAAPWENIRAFFDASAKFYS